MSLQAELSASQRELVQVSGTCDMTADEKAKLSEQHAQLAQELEAARAQKHESMSAAAAQHGAVAEALSKELDEARVRLRLTRRFGACLLFVKIRSGQGSSRDSSPCTNISI